MWMLRIHGGACCRHTELVGLVRRISFPSGSGDSQTRGVPVIACTPGLGRRRRKLARAPGSVSPRQGCRQRPSASGPNKPARGAPSRSHRWLLLGVLADKRGRSGVLVTSASFLAPLVNSLLEARRSRLAMSGIVSEGVAG